jgi:type IV secretion system protein VirB5
MNIKSLFTHPKQFTYDENLLSPAEKAARKWDEREGGIIEQNQNLRRLLMGLILVIIILAAALAFRASTDYSTVYVVETDINTGEVRNVGTANQMKNYQPGDAVFNFFLKQFVQNVRAIPLDEVVLNQHREEAIGFLTKDGATMLQAEWDRENHFGKVGIATVQVAINSILPMDGGKSYQVRWTETEFRLGTNAKTVTPYTGVFTVEIIKSTDKQQLDVNPLGIYITDLHWDRDANVPVENSGNAR